MSEFLDAEGQSRVKFAVLDAYVAYHVKAARYEFPKTGRYKRTGGQQAPAVFIPGLGMTRADTGTAIGEDGSASDNAFDEEKARNDAFKFCQCPGSSNLEPQVGALAVAPSHWQGSS